MDQRQFDQLQQIGPQVPMIGQDPGAPTKREQFRLIALQTVTQLGMGGHISLSGSQQAGDIIVGHAKAIEKYLNNG